MVTVAVLGMGVRGKTYADIAVKLTKITAVCDPDINKLELARKQYNVPADRCFQNDADFFKAGKLADSLFICTQDSDHFRHAMEALRLGYDILLEKPISNTLFECEELKNEASRLGRKISVCHVLRYSYFANEIKKLLDSGALGKVVHISQTERIGYFHFAHSFVRGSWSNSKKSSPIILSKCCHDLDLISYFADSKCKFVSSTGCLTYFKGENKPEKAADFCYKCSVRKECAYDAVKFYSENRLWTDRTGTFFEEFNNENILKWLSDEENPYARCAFNCDNDVCDRQTVNMTFENGVEATLLMTAFSNKRSRKISIFCTNGEIEGEMETGVITVSPFGKKPYTLDINEIHGDVGAHGGGDKRLVLDFLKNDSDLTEISDCIESHKIAFEAEKSRKKDGR